MHQAMAAALDAVIEEIRRIQIEARAAAGSVARPRWPMIVLVSPKGWTGPKMVDGKRNEGTFRSHQVPLTDPASHPEHLRQLEEWLRSYRPAELFDARGRLKADLAALAPSGERRMGANPNANGGMLLRDLRMPDFRDYAVECIQTGCCRYRRYARAGKVLTRRGEVEFDAAQLPHLRPGRNGIERLGGRVRGRQSPMAGGTQRRR